MLLAGEKALECRAGPGDETCEKSAPVLEIPEQPRPRLNRPAISLIHPSTTRGGPETKKIGRTPAGFGSRNTCQHGERVLNFTQDGGRLVVTEALLGERAEFVRVDTGVGCGTRDTSMLACCSLGREVLVMGGGRDGVFAALVGLGGGRLSAPAVRVAGLAVEGDREWPDWPYLCQASGSRALLWFDCKSSVCYCEVAGPRLVMARCGSAIPAGYGFNTVPIRLPDGRLLAAGSGSYSADITLVATCGDPAFERAGSIPGPGRESCSAALVRGRFAVGFGGFDGGLLADLWVFDLRTRQSSPVRRRGEWHPGDRAVPVAVLGEALFLVGGRWTTHVNSLALPALADLIAGERVRRDFRAALGLPVRPGPAYRRRGCRLALFRAL